MTWVPGLTRIQWLSQEGLMPKLIERLSSNHPSDMHAAASEVIKGIIAIAAPSPLLHQTSLHENRRYGRVSHSLPGIC